MFEALDIGPDFRTARRLAFSGLASALASVLPGGTPTSDPFFDTSATFIGAIGSTDWTTGWTSYPVN